MQSHLGTVDFEVGGDLKNSFVLVSAGDEGQIHSYVEKELLLFRMSGNRVGNGEEYAKFQSIECNVRLNGIKERLVFVCLRWITDDEMD